MKNKELGRRLLDLKERIEDQKQKRAEMQGALKSLMQRLKQEFDIESVDQAEEKVKKEEAELRDLETDIREKIEELEELLDET